MLLEVLQEGGDTAWHRLVVVKISRKEVCGSTDGGGSSNVAMLIFTEQKNHKKLRELFKRFRVKEQDTSFWEYRNKHFARASFLRL